MSQLHHYLARLHDTIRSRQEIIVELLEIYDRSDQAGKSSEFYALLRFYDDSQLQVTEKLIVEQFVIFKSRYSYHYQASDDSLLFRYDNAPHYPQLKTYPHHTHIGEEVFESQPPDLGDVLREIDALLYPEN